LSDVQRSRPPRRDFRRGGEGGGFNRGGGFRRDRPAPGGPGVDYRALVEYIAKSLAEKPEEVTVEAYERGGGTVAIKVKLGDEDIGRFIGRVTARPQTRLRRPGEPVVLVPEHGTARPAFRRRGERMIRVGQVMGAFGVAGAVKVLPLTDFMDRFDPGARLVLDGCLRQVEWSRESRPGIVVKLSGIENRTFAELFRGRYLEVAEEEVRKLEEGRFYHRQVVGLAVFTSSGERLGVVAEILERPANDVWVSREGTVEHLIPATKDAVLEVDVAAGRVVVADWLVQVEDARD
jgi:16S rRNA processing protein RimM